MATLPYLYELDYFYSRPFILLFFIHFTFLYIDFILYGAVRLSIVSFMTPIIASVFYSDIPWHAIDINITDLYFL